MFKNINKAIKILVAVDFFYNSAFASFAPVFAIFVTSKIQGGSASVVGFAIAMFWLVKSIVQLPIARFLDRTDGERDDFWAMFFGYFLSGLVPLGYLFVSQPWHLYILQGFFGFLMAWAAPAWYGIFTRHVDKWRVSFEWSMESVFALGLATAGAAALGGYAVDRFGFDVLFLTAAFISFTASFGLLFLKKHLSRRIAGEKIMPEKRHYNRRP